jgi:hypothetical protein
MDHPRTNNRAGPHGDWDRIPASASARIIAPAVLAILSQISNLIWSRKHRRIRAESADNECNLERIRLNGTGHGVRYHLRRERDAGCRHHIIAEVGAASESRSVRVDRSLRSRGARAQWDLRAKRREASSLYGPERGSGASTRAQAVEEFVSVRNGLI